MNAKVGKSNNRIINLAGFFIILLTVAVKCVRSMDAFQSAYFLKNIFCAPLYILFFLFWIITIKQRVIQKNIRIALLSIAWLELFWILVRTIKFEIRENEILLRYGWYLYYLPMLLIPALFLILAVSMGKPESDRPRKFLYAFPLFSLLLFVFVLTNDIHKMVFIIPPGIEGLESGNYGYGPGYFVITVYIGLCVLASYGILLVKCRVNNGRFKYLLPLILLAIGTFLCVINFFKGSVLFGFYHLDISLIICFTATFTLEACMQSRLLLTNNGYDELFRLCNIQALITDKDFNAVIASGSYSEITPENRKAAEREPIMLNGGMRLSSAPTKDGYVFWQDDVSELDGVLRELSDVNDYLSGKNVAIQQAYAYKKRERQLTEKNRCTTAFLHRPDRRLSFMPI